MKTLISFLGAICFLTLQTVSAQDLHFTNYDYAPLYLNPAQTGDFAGTARASGIFREQFSSFIEEPFVTGMGAAEVNFNFALRKQDWTSVGLAVHFDQVGALSLQNTGTLLSLGYHYALDKKRKSVLTLAGQYSLFQRTIKGQWNPEDMILTGSTADLGLFENFDSNGSGNNFNVGLQYNTKISKTNSFELGASMYHILQPTEKDNFAPRRITAHGSLYTQLNKKVALEYAAFYSTATNVNNLMLQVRSYFSFNKQKRVDRKKVTIDRGQFMFGLGYRANDALLFLTGYEYKKWQFGVSYDMTVSSASNYNNYYGAIELGIRRVFLITKRPEIKPVLICPTL